MINKGLDPLASVLWTAEASEIKIRSGQPPNYNAFENRVEYIRFNTETEVIQIR